jgi:hypothetical protein
MTVVAGVSPAKWLRSGKPVPAKSKSKQPTRLPLQKLALPRLAVLLSATGGFASPATFRGHVSAPDPIGPDHPTYN